VKEQPGDIVQHYLSRSHEAYKEARVLAETGHWNTTVSRLYYSCFYAASALLQKNGLSSFKHSGVRSLFNNHFTRTEVIPKEISAIYNDLFDRRQESDYGPFFVFEEADVEPWFDEVNRFIAKIADTINQKH
jgi:uncharacterized protein (UPF0332 family)